ncbi:MAG TPA: 4-(cytidine 5'-diphospho)-2-C-methyl-D-erythritol kinase [Gemmatimonadaceae bacterium]|nr:4-(cytidine 5'-diphospho)-2-C-methyl-D-erythritol kinase [Gemmatimonadaceae bacterium]
MSAPASRDLPRGATARTIAQAKVNLFLRVLAREADGYHQIETLFARLELGDPVTVRTAVRGRSLDCAGESMPPDGLGPVERNLAWRAAVAFAGATGWPNDWAIEVTKRIPVGGGLGGGSADAGAVLRCLNVLSPRSLPLRDLLALASTLGADVPFVTLEAPLALAWGRGERLLSLPSLPRRSVTLACFPFGVSTPAAFGWLDDERGTFRPAPAVHERDALSSWGGVSAIAHNDFEPIVAARYAEVARALAAFRGISSTDPAALAVLTGSGSTVAYLSSSDADHARARDGRLAGIASRLMTTRTADAVVGVEVAG